MRNPPVDLCDLLDRIALQEQTAAMAAEIARQADRTGQLKSGDVMWTTVRRCRVRALQLRAEAVVQIGAAGAAPVRWTGQGKGPRPIL